jgi:hypothetical protein
MDDIAQVRANNQTSAGRNAGDRLSDQGRHGKQKKTKFKFVVIAIVVILLLGALSFGGWSFYQSGTSSSIDESKYQAVFLTNGQVYFGKLHIFNGSYMKLNDIFYLQTKTAASSENPQVTSDQSTPDVQLIKLGNEIHGPVDEMVISKDQILFFENLKKDSKVTDSIVKYQKQ